MKLTKNSVAALTLPAGKSELLVFDDALSGFGVRLRAGGSRTWIVQYQVGRKQRRVSIGPVSGLALEKAREKAGIILARVRLGEDPQADKFKVRAKAAETLGAVVERFLMRQKARLRPRTIAEQERHLKTHWKPLHGVQIGGIDRAMVTSRIAELVEKNGPTSADHARTSLSTLFSWALREGLVEANPVAATNKPSHPRSRDRVLRDEELREIWSSCRDDDHGRIIKLLLLTGQRRDEIAGLRWAEIDVAKALITLPGERTKNGRAHDVPLSDPALAVLPGRRDGRDYVFGEGEGPFSGFSAAKRKMDDRILRARRDADESAKPMVAWRLHDLRRTMATRLGDLGVHPHVVEAVLNHVSGSKAGVAGIYNKAVYAAEKRAALILWAEHVMGVIGQGDSKVVVLRTVGGDVS